MGGLIGSTTSSGVYRHASRARLLFSEKCEFFFSQCGEKGGSLALWRHPRAPPAAAARDQAAAPLGQVGGGEAGGQSCSSCSILLVPSYVTTGHVRLLASLSYNTARSRKASGGCSAPPRSHLRRLSARACASVCPARRPTPRGSRKRRASFFFRTHVDTLRTSSCCGTSSAALRPPARRARTTRRWSTTTRIRATWARSTARTPTWARGSLARRRAGTS